MASPAWRPEPSDTYDARDPLPETRRVRWQLFLVVPALLLLAAGWLLAAGAALGSAMLTVFIYSFIIMTPIAIYSCAREIWARLRSSRS